ncbi:dihydrolipoamide acetyltransferase family protein [Haloglomus litoreum]|uniref:dihydrolipoamide acetyltransferase family protein n=1 Tax=Haloglomus litoreum TaxID=3034026 RepID=UPI0023E7964F|nr:dihydrolipoamide acetyltransferase family protein [Haloglomus sp. DT116]
MAYLVNMPKLEQGMQQGILMEWLVDIGESVSEGEPIAEIESEKTVAEIDAREDGVLRQTFVEAGETVSPGTPLGVVAGADESIDDLLASVDVDTSPDAGAEPDDPEPAVAPQGGGERPQETGGGSQQAVASTSDSSGSAPERVSPAARRRAEELGVDVSSVDGTGPEGAVISDDIERRAAAAGEATVDAKQRAAELGIDLGSVEGTGPRNAATVADVERAAGDIRERRELSGMRQTIARRLGQSHRDAPHVTVHRDIDVEELLEATGVADRYADADISMTDLLLVAVSATLADHPEFNATFEDGVHTLHESHHIGVAVDIEGGLVTPVVETVDSLALGDLAERRRSLTQTVLDGEFTGEDISGGTFTVSNLGVFGVESFTPIINPPEVAILGVDTISEKPVRDGDDVAFRKHMGFDLSFDHRVVDGADAARFLQTLDEYIREPWPLLLDRA